MILLDNKPYFQSYPDKKMISLSLEVLEAYLNALEGKPYNKYIRNLVVSDQYFACTRSKFMYRTGNNEVRLTESIVIYPETKENLAMAISLLILRS